MVDKIGRTLNPGDEVIFIANATTKPEIEFGIVKRIHLNDNECSVQCEDRICAHVYSNRVLSAKSVRNIKLHKPELY